MDWYEIISLTMSGIGLVGCFWFAIDYQLRTKGAWIRHDAGRFMMADRAALASLLFLIFAARVFGDWPGRRIVSLIFFILYMAFAWWPLRLLHHAPGVKQRD